MILASNRLRFRHCLACWVVVLLLVGGLGPYVHAQQSDEELSPIQVMIQVVLSDSTDLSLRRNHAAILFKDPQAHPALVEMLNSDAPKTTELRFDVPSIGENWTVKISYKVEDVKIQRDKATQRSVTIH